MRMRAYTPQPKHDSAERGDVSQDLSLERGQLLAVGAKVAAAISNGKTLDGSTADRARLAAEVSNAEVELGSA